MRKNIDLSCNFLLFNDKKALKKFGLRTWCTKKPFGYRVIHHSKLKKRLAIAVSELFITNISEYTLVCNPATQSHILKLCKQSILTQQLDC